MEPLTAMVLLLLVLAGVVLVMLGRIVDLAINPTNRKNQKTGVKAFEMLALARKTCVRYDNRNLYSSYFSQARHDGIARIYFPESHRESDEMEAVLIAAHEAGHSHQSRSPSRRYLEYPLRVSLVKRLFLVLNAGFLSRIILLHSWGLAWLLIPFVVSLSLVLHNEWDASRRAIRLIRHKNARVDNGVAWRFFAPCLISHATGPLAIVVFVASAIVSIVSILNSLFS